MIKLQNEIAIPVIDKTGKLVKKTVYKNVPYMWLFGESPIVIIDWIANGENRPTPEELAEPIEYEGVTYYGFYFAGSNVKDCKTFGVPFDIAKSLMKYAQDSNRGSRWALAQGLYGAAITTVTVKVVETGTLIGDYATADGMSLIKKSLADEIYNDRKKIKLGRARGTYTMHQRINMNEACWNEVQPGIDERMANIKSLHHILMEQHASYEERKRLYTLNPAMLNHPYIALSLQRAMAEWFARAVTTLPIPETAFIAVPVPQIKKVLTDHRIWVNRNPADSPGSIQAIEPEDLPEVIEYWLKHVASLEVYQHSISNADLSIKGCVTSVPDLEYDLIIGHEDIKMSNLDWEIGGIYTAEVYIGFTQAYEKGTCIGINPEWGAEYLGLDFDGDIANTADMRKFPEIFKSISQNMQISTAKLTKVKDDRTDENIISAIYKQMANIVGWATNLTSDFHQFHIDEQAHIANFLGYKSLETCEVTQNFFVKAGTDIFKTSLDLTSLEPQIAHFYDGMESIVFEDDDVKMPFRGAPYKSWPNNYFTNKVPVVIDKIYYDKNTNQPVYVVDGDFTELDEDDLDNAIWPFMDGTIAEICRRSLPALEEKLDEPISVTPLNSYVNWAKYVEPEHMQAAKELQTWYNARAAVLSWTNPHDVNVFKTKFHEFTVAELAKFKMTREQMAHALWRVAHQAKDRNTPGNKKMSYGKQAASVFIEFSQEIEPILVDMPGKDLRYLVVTGLQYQLPDVTEWTGEVEIVQFNHRHKGKDVLRTALVATVPGQVQPQNTQFPENMIGLIAKNSYQPTVGKYMCHLTLNTAKSWTCSIN